MHQLIQRPRRVPNRKHSRINLAALAGCDSTADHKLFLLLNRYIAMSPNRFIGLGSTSDKLSNSSGKLLVCPRTISLSFSRVWRVFSLSESLQPFSWFLSFAFVLYP